MDRRSFLQVAAMLAAAHAAPHTALATVEPSTLLASDPASPVDQSAEDWGCPTVVKVLGIGRAGCNVVEHMVHERVPGVEYVFIDTSAGALKRTSPGTYLQLGASGLGSMGQADLARAIALGEQERIADVLRGAHLVFIVAGMGGGTGSGVAPVVAQIARQLEIVNVALTIQPFAFEGNARQAMADEGMARLAQNVDSSIVLLNDGMSHALGEHATLLESFAQVDTLVKLAIGSTATVINVPSLVGIDFEDVRTVLATNGRGRMCFATASGPDRAHQAALQAVESPSLGRKNLLRARGLLVTITAASSLRMSEINEVMNTVRDEAGEEAQMIFGTIRDESLADTLRVTLIATGIPA
jgi:cell division protein FtsZ